LNKNKAFGVRTLFYQMVRILGKECYNVATMRYEQNGNSFLCVGLRGFICEGLSAIAPVA
jgi:hypothetical protein